MEVTRWPRTANVEFFGAIAFDSLKHKILHLEDSYNCNHAIKQPIMKGIELLVKECNNFPFPHYDQHQSLGRLSSLTNQ